MLKKIQVKVDSGLKNLEGVINNAGNDTAMEQAKTVNRSGVPCTCTSKKC